MKISQNKIKNLIRESVLEEMNNPRPRKLKIKQLGIPHKLEPNPSNRGDMALVNAAIKLHQQFGQPVERDLIDAQTNQEITRYYQNNYHYNSDSGHVYTKVYSKYILPPFGDTVFRMLNGRIRDVSRYLNKEEVKRRLREGEIYPNFYESLRAQGIRGVDHRNAEEKLIEGLGKLARHRIRLLSDARDLVDGNYRYNNYSMTSTRFQGNSDPMEYISDWLIKMQEILYEYDISYHMP